MMGQQATPASADVFAHVPGGDEMVAILDAGAQYAKVIDRKVCASRLGLAEVLLTLD
jgi:hypothetical protein